MKRILYFATIFVLIIETSTAQKYNFKNYSVQDGLTNLDVSCINEDHLGNIWIGTKGGGLLKHDGHSFLNYGLAEGLGNLFINTIHQKPNKDIWIGTNEGIFIFNGKSIDKLPLKTPLLNDIINTIREDDSGYIWIGTEHNGLLQLKNDSAIVLNTKNGLYSNSIKSIYIAKGCCIWIGTDKGLNKYKHGEIINIPKKYRISNTSINGICKDTLGNYWFTTNNSSAFYYDNKKFWNYTVLDGLLSNNLTSILCDNNGNIWFGSDMGLMKHQDGSFKFFTEENGLGSNHINCLYRDRFNNLWIGTRGGGLTKFDNEKFVHFPEKKNFGKWIYSIAQAPNNNIVFATSEGGITVFDGNNFILLKGISGFTYSNVNKLHYAKDNSLWIATKEDGLYKFDNYRFKRYSKANGLAGDNITDVTTDANGNAWAACDNKGLSLILADSSAKIRNFNTSDSLLGLKIQALTIDSSNILWVGSSKGLNKVSIENSKSIKIEKIATLNINSIVTDSSGNIFLGTPQGIKIYSNKNFMSITIEHGLKSNNINSLIFDSNSQLWAGCEQGTHQISFKEDLSVNKLNFFGVNEGFKGVGTLQNSCCIDKKGNLWFGTPNGAIKFNPLEDFPRNKAPLLQITGIRLFFDKIQDTGYGDSIENWLFTPEKLELPHHKNNLSFEFIGIYHPNPKAVKYKWRLKGFDENWSPILKQNEAIYSNLPPGKYTFQVMACNENNIWVQEPVEYKFEILKPYWDEIWFQGTLIGAGALLLWFIFFLRLRQIKRRNKATQLKLKMERDLIELEQEASRLQMNPHFIFNSLNSIQGFIATNDAFQAKRYLAKFARLMRLILENSREELIPLENEIETLETYLELEKLRLNNKFDYSINIESNLETDFIELPPMLIQPFVENSIIHGLKYKEGKGKIELSFSLKKGILICEITDNGIGREKAMANKLPDSKHKSSGMNVTTKRLEQLNLQTGKIAGMEIIDLKDENNNALGTKVIVRIPLTNPE